MHSIRRILPHRTNWFFATFAVLATVAQLVVGLAPLGESRIARTFSAHVEAGGTTAHVAHNEATCASCQARSIHGTAPRASFAPPELARSVSAPVADAPRTFSSGLSRQTNPRAPPVVI